MGLINNLRSAPITLHFLLTQTKDKMLGSCGNLLIHSLVQILASIGPWIWSHGDFSGEESLRHDLGNKVENMLIKFKVRLLVSAFGKICTEQNPTSLSFTLWHFHEKMSHSLLWKRVMLPLGTEVYSSIGKGEWKIVFLFLKSYSAHLQQKKKHRCNCTVPRYLREIQFAHVYQGVEPKVKNWDEDKNKKWI